MAQSHRRSWSGVGGFQGDDLRPDIQVTTSENSGGFLWMKWMLLA